MSLKNTIFHFNPSRKRLKEFLQRAAASAGDSAQVLDAGAGESLYKELFSHTNYLAIDFGKLEKAYNKINVICDLKDIPFIDGKFDMVICTQVLEHVPEPGLVLAEINRILKHGGRLWLSAPFFFPEHEIPYDFYRYTQYGLRHLITSAGFSIIELEWMEGYFGSLSYQLRVAARAIPIKPGSYSNYLVGWLLLLPLLLLKPFLFGISLIFSWIEAFGKKYTADGFCKNYTIIAIKENN
jgi:SAM-dependent methyltransferase